MRSQGNARGERCGHLPTPSVRLHRRAGAATPRHHRGRLQRRHADATACLGSVVENLDRSKPPIRADVRMHVVLVAREVHDRVAHYGGFGGHDRRRIRVDRGLGEDIGHSGRKVHSAQGRAAAMDRMVVHIVQHKPGNDGTVRYQDRRHHHGADLSRGHIGAQFRVLDGVLRNHARGANERAGGDRQHARQPERLHAWCQLLAGYRTIGEVFRLDRLGGDVGALDGFLLDMPTGHGILLDVAGTDRHGIGEQRNCEQRHRTHCNVEVL